ncbi:MAG: hypothetical protein WD403_08860 [Pirellulales bacterium]
MTAPDEPDTLRRLIGRGRHKSNRGEIMKTLTFALLLCVAAVATGQQVYVDRAQTPPAAPRASENAREPLVPSGGLRAYEEIPAPHPAPRMRGHYSVPFEYDPPRQPRQPYMPNSVTSRPAALAPAPLGAAPHSTAETKIDHLLQAAAHLEAAGFSDQAAEARKKADDHKRALLQRLLDQRLAEVELLKTEIARLQSSPVEMQRTQSRSMLPIEKPDRQVLVQVRMLELECDNPDMAAFDLPWLTGPREETIELESRDEREVRTTIKKLQEQNLIKILAEPDLVARVGQAACFHSGGELPLPRRQADGSVAIEMRQFGTRVDALPTLLGNNTVRLALKARFSQLDDTCSVVVDGRRYPGLRSREIDTSVDIRFGQTLVLAGLYQRNPTTGDRLADDEAQPSHQAPADDSPSAGRGKRFVVLVTPQLVDGLSPSPASAGGSETIDDDRAVFIRRDRNARPLPSAGKDGRSKR